MRIRWLLFSAVAAGLIAGSGCKTAVEPSPEPGTLRVVFKSADNDTAIIIQNDTSRFSRWDNFNIIVSQCRLYAGDNYAYVYNNPTSSRKADDTVNALAREWLTGVPITTQDSDSITASNSRFRTFVVFESYIPPGSYQKMSLSVTASEMEFFIPKHYLNPVSLPPGVTPTMEFPVEVSVSERGVTEITLELSPYKSLRRYQDQFYFERKLVVKQIRNL